MKETIAAMSIMILGIVGGIFLIYAGIGFISWITSDPFNWIPDGQFDEEYVAGPDPSISDCRESGGIPIVSSWSNRLKRCDPKPTY